MIYLKILIIQKYQIACTKKEKRISLSHGNYQKTLIYGIKLAETIR